MQHFPASALWNKMADRKRIRSSNWSKNESSLLKNLVSEYESTLSCRHSNEVTNRKKKKEIWEYITNQINLLGVCKRTVSEVKIKWRNVARCLKQEFSEHRKESTKTGGGPPPCSPCPEDQRLISLFEKTSSFYGVPGGIDMEPFIAEGKFLQLKYI